MVKPILIKLYINSDVDEGGDVGMDDGGGGGGSLGAVDDSVIIRYPMETSNRCYWCYQKFATTPVFTPMRFDEAEQLFYVRDNFCSFSHAASYIQVNYKSESVERMSLLYYLQFKMKGSWEPIPLVPPIQLVCAEWGVGKLSVEEYMRLGVDKRVDIYYPPLIPSRHVVVDAEGSEYERR